MPDGARVRWWVLHLSFRGGCSSGVERLTVAQEVAGSKPVTHPNHKKPSADAGGFLFPGVRVSRTLHGFRTRRLAMRIPVPCWYTFHTLS